VATSATTVEMLYFHPIYEYKNGQVRQWTNIAVDAVTVNGHTVNADVPSDAEFTDTTYESKAAAQNGTDVSLVTTGEKYIWNNKTTYSISMSGNVITLTGSDSSTSTVTLPVYAGGVT